MGAVETGHVDIGRHPIANPRSRVPEMTDMSSFLGSYGWLLLFGVAFFFMMRMHGGGHAGGHAGGGCGMGHGQSGGHGDHQAPMSHDGHEDAPATGRPTAAVSAGPAATTTSGSTEVAEQRRHRGC